ncbi:MAG: hypothetical protein IPP73_17565 [Chitinophagaceae bacterium]|nr:hypothetical protein [Chitinophagaceae bacterium]
MKKIILFVFLLLSKQPVFSQDEEKKPTKNTYDSYLVYSPFSWLEGQMPVGLGFARQFTERSEVYTELAWVTKSPFYSTEPESLSGFRAIAQYRYHINSGGFPIFGFFRRQKRFIRNVSESFIGLEGRIKTYNFSAKYDFINPTAADTLHKYLYKANAFVWGGAIIFGKAFSISRNDRLQAEINIGIGGKEKTVKYKNLPAGYKPVTTIGGWGLKPPGIQESMGNPYFPCAVRIRYAL